MTSTDNKKSKTTTIITTGTSHFIVLIFALFLAWNCSKTLTGMNKALNMVAAFLCPQCYILYILLMKRNCIFCNTGSDTSPSSP